MSTKRRTIEEALRLWLGRETEGSLVREWEEGYRRLPESIDEIDAAEAGACLAFDPEDNW
jgi:hypothetical protein